MTILHLSDTHDYHRQLNSLREAEIVIHSGDFTKTGSETEQWIL